MRSVIRSVCWLAAAALTTGCAAAPAVDMNVENQALDNLARVFEKAVDSGDVNALVGMYTPEFAVYEDGQADITSMAGLRDFFNNFTQMKPSHTTIHMVSRDIAAAGDLAVEAGTFTSTFQTPSGPVNSTGRYVVTFKKINGAWKIMRDMGNSAGPHTWPPVAAAPAK